MVHKRQQLIVMNVTLCHYVPIQDRCGFSTFSVLNSKWLVQYMQWNLRTMDTPTKDTSLCV